MIVLKKKKFSARSTRKQFSETISVEKLESLLDSGSVSNVEDYLESVGFHQYDSYIYDGIYDSDCSDEDGDDYEEEPVYIMCDAYTDNSGKSKVRIYYADDNADEITDYDYEIDDYVEEFSTHKHIANRSAVNKAFSNCCPFDMDELEYRLGDDINLDSITCAQWAEIEKQVDKENVDIDEDEELYYAVVEDAIRFVCE